MGQTRLFMPAISTARHSRLTNLSALIFSPVITSPAKIGLSLATAHRSVSPI
jgi:hypothetical protein